MSNNKILSSLFEQVTGQQPAQIAAMPSSGSNRLYFRLYPSTGARTMIGVIGTCREENDAFIYLADHFRSKGLPVPEVLAISDDHMAYLQEDLGDTILFNAIEKGRQSRSFSADEKELLIRTIRMLPDIQFLGAVGLDFSHCYPAKEFDKRSIMWILIISNTASLKPPDWNSRKTGWRTTSRPCPKYLCEANRATFMYRDFQSRNVMLTTEGNPLFIDFQGGRKGPFYYDVASFLWQAKANLPGSLRQELIGEYINALRKYKPVDEEYFHEQLRHFVLFRTMQALGAYGFRGYFEKKPHFMQSVPFAIANLRELLDNPYPEYPYLNELLRQLVDMKQFTNEMANRQLTVKVMSFAYKKGIPNDATGNGGGYVFDCRAVNNPGNTIGINLLPDLTSQ